MNRIVVFTNGCYTNLDFYRKKVNTEDYIICADGGANYALSLGIQPNMVVGDLDSINHDLYKELLNSHVKIEKYPCEKDMSDLEIALQKAVEQNPSEIVILGALGNRLDQTLSNLYLLLVPTQNKIKATIIDEHQQVQLVDKQLVVEGNRDEYLSLIPLTAEVTGITTQGLKFPLQEETLYFASTRGLSNEFINKEATITVKSGYLLAVKVKKRW